MSEYGSRDLEALNREIVKCRLCRRLVEYREYISKVKVRRFRDWDYWGKPLPGFGDVNARLFIVGLAPAAHGGNRTGRMFTGDSSGDWLVRALYHSGFANQPYSISRDDGLVLRDVYISAIVRCAPPKNRPLKSEILNCRRYLKREFEILRNVKVILTLGRLSFENTLETLYELGVTDRKKYPFGHGKVYILGDITLISSYHPSRQNTQTGRLTWDMWIDIFRKVREVLNRHG